MRRNLDIASIATIGIASEVEEGTVVLTYASCLNKHFVNLNFEM